MARYTHCKIKSYSSRIQTTCDFAFYIRQFYGGLTLAALEYAVQREVELALGSVCFCVIFISADGDAPRS